MKAKQYLALVTVVVEDYDAALEFYVNKLNFTLVEDRVLAAARRWVVVAPPGSQGCGLLLAKAANEEQKSRIGNQTGGRVFLFINTTNFEKDFQNLINNKIKIVREPYIETFGKVAVFADLYGNHIDLIQPN